MTTEGTLTHGQLVDDTPEGWKADKHATFADSGLVCVTAPGTALDGVVVRPGQQLNYVEHDGEVTSYSIGPDEQTEVARTTEEPPEDEATPTSETPEPQASTTGRTPEPQKSSTEDEDRPQDQSNFDGDAAGEPDDTGNDWPKGGDGGWYELSNGKKIQGEDAAIEAQAKLDGEPPVKPDDTEIKGRSRT